MCHIRSTAAAGSDGDAVRERERARDGEKERKRERERERETDREREGRKGGREGERTLGRKVAVEVGLARLVLRPRHLCICTLRQPSPDFTQSRLERTAKPRFRPWLSGTSP